MHCPIKACVIPICKNEKFNLVHKFPADKERFTKWMEAIESEKHIEKLANLSNEAIRKRFFICSRHFSLQQYKNIQSRSLNITAVPSLNLSNLDELTLSKASQLESNVEATRDTTDVEDSSKHQRILNFHASSFTSKKRPSNSPKIIFEQCFEDEFEDDVIEKPSQAKRLRDLSSEQNEELPKEDGTSTRREQDEISLATTFTERAIEPQNLEPSSQPHKKLLALIEVTPEEYEKLSSSLSTAERSQHITSIMSFIENSEPDPVTDNEMNVELPDGTKYKIDPFWLRDHCRCNYCYDSSNHQRKISVLDIPEDINARSFKVEKEKLSVVWNNNHESSYELNFLTKYLGEDNMVQLEVCLWNKAAVEVPFKEQLRVTMRDYMSDQRVSKKVLENLHVYGVALIEGVQPTQQNTEFVIRQLFPVHKTLFGEMWTFSDAKTHSDSAYTNIYLGPHTDNTYFNDAAGLQILHCIQHSGSGGENFLIDGYRVARNIKMTHPEVFDRLTKTMVTGEYIEDGRHHKHAAPIINLCPVTGEVLQIRFNLNDRAPFRIDSVRNIRQFYDDLRIFTQEFEEPDNRITFKLEPGCVLIFDNWRILHGRLAYSGKRTMTGCYVARTEYQSCLRVNGFIE